MSQQMPKELIEKALNRHGEFCLHLAAKQDDPAVVEVLLELGANAQVYKPQNQSTPLHVAAHHGKGDVLRKLLDCGAELNAKTTSGWLPIHSAIAYSTNPSVVDELLARHMHQLPDLPERGARHVKRKYDLLKERLLARTAGAAGCGVGGGFDPYGFLSI